MRQLLLTISYDGTDFSGWQVQKNASTVQGEIEKAIKRVTGEEIRILGSSRTDAGVHALGQRATFFSNMPIPPERWPLALKRYLSKDITITSCVEVPAEFHPIYHVQRKRYSYYIYTGKCLDFRLKRYVWHLTRHLNLQAMREALLYLQGQHDFATFCAAGSKVSSTVRTIYKTALTLKRENLIEISFEGDGFLYKMIRIIVASLVGIGLEERAPLEMKKIILSRDRREAPKTAPPQGLVLEQIWYNPCFKV